MVFARLLLTPTVIFVFLGLLLVSMAAAVGQATGGDMLAYVKEESNHADIFMVDFRTRHSVNLTHGVGENQQPVWSPDGRRLAYTSQRVPEPDTLLDISSNYEVFVMNLPTGISTNYTQYPRVDSTPQWAPDGDRLSFFSVDRVLLKPYIMAVDAPPAQDRSHIRLLSNIDITNSNNAWSADGQKLLFISSGQTGNSNEVYIVELTTPLPDVPLQARLLLPESFERIATFDPAWSPDGTQVAFIIIRQAAPNRFVENIYLIEADGSTPRQLTNFTPEQNIQLRNVAAPAWSPDGRYLAFIAIQDKASAVYLLDMRTGALNNVVEGVWPGREVWLRTPAWSPDGQKLAFVAEFPGTIANSVIYWLAPDEGRLHLLTGESTSLNRNPVWRP